jgi:magnesium-protoporphyrin O-methyltransferase
VVTLDRVICCYDDLEGLVRASASKARRLYGLVLPRETGWTRLAIGLMNLEMALTRSTFRSHVHSTRRLEELLRELGFSAGFAGRTTFWQVRVYRR